MASAPHVAAADAAGAGGTSPLGAAGSTANSSRRVCAGHRRHLPASAAAEPPLRSRGARLLGVRGVGVRSRFLLCCVSCERHARSRSTFLRLDDYFPDGGGSNRPGDIVRVVLVLFVIVGLAYGLDLSPKSGARLPAATHTSGAVNADTVQHAATHAEARPVRLPQTAAACAASLKQAGVEYREIAAAAADGISWPIRLTGPIGGIRIEGGATPEADTNYLDCRLAATLLAWAPSLRARGIVAIEHYSMYRPLSRVNGSDKPSGHAAGRAIDVGRVELEDGRMLSVLTDWKNRKANADPCAEWRDDDAGRLLRDLACDAAERGYFQVIVTPHHNAAHANHLHLEIDPAGGSLWMR